jgi:hypothetical protein
VHSEFVSIPRGKLFRGPCRLTQELLKQEDTSSDLTLLSPFLKSFLKSFLKPLLKPLLKSFLLPLHPRSL